MADALKKPTALILGGINTCSRALASYLVPLDGEPLVSYLRIVDKYSVRPATAYIGPEFPKVLEQPNVEYRQANLMVAETVQSVFNPPPGHDGFDYVFDFTGEVRLDRTDVIHIKSTVDVARLAGLEAAKRKVKAYVRLHLPFYETSTKTPHTEKEDIKPVGPAGIWWHETLRVLGAIQDLNLVILRVGLVYGPYIDYGTITGAMTVAALYGHMQKPVKSLWSPKNPNNTLHILDLAGGAFAAARWIAGQGRVKANELAGEKIPFHNDKGKIKEVEGVPAPDANIVAPLFNLVDDANSTLLSTGSTITSCFGTTFEFFNIVESTVFKVMEDMEEINEHHVVEWDKMLQASKPPVSHTPLTVYMDKFALEKNIVALRNDKFKSIVGYTLQKPEFNQAQIMEIVDKWKQEGIWPNV